MKYLQVTMPDGSIWGVPLSLIARNRANYYAYKNDECNKEVYEEEYQNTFNDPDLAIDWAENNMDWEDVEFEAKMIAQPKVDFQEGWINGDKEIVELGKES